MSTPLFISESIPLEIRNVLKSLEIGMPARYQDFTGTIEFVSEEYITLCISEKPNPEGSRHPMNKCCLLVYSRDWDDLEIEDTHFQDKRNYHGEVNCHPGNEMLPHVDDR